MHIQNLGKSTEYSIDDRGLLNFRGRVYVHNQLSFKQMFLDEFHRNPYVAHRGYHTLFSTIKKGVFSVGNEEGNHAIFG